MPFCILLFNFVINMGSKEISNRIAEVINENEMTATSFADKIGVPRSSISHILNGRNKPSLDFVMKVCDTFDDIDMYWLLYGKGSPFNSRKENIPDKKPNLKMDKANLSLEKTIKRIVIFFEDGTFEEYKDS